MAEFVYDATDKRSVNTLIGRVYGRMFFNLILTAVIAIGMGLIFNLLIFGTLSISSDLGNIDSINGTGLTTLLILLIVSAIALFIMSFVVHLRGFRGKSLTIPTFLYCALMGILLSTLVMFVPWPVLGITFAITAGIFGIMFLISYISRGSLNALGMIGFGLLIGAAIISLIGWIFMLTGFLGDYIQLYWIISLISFAAIMLITIWDMWRIKKIAEEGAMSDNIVLYCAFILYVDFIYIFLRVLRFVLYFMSRRN
ncbi:MAG: Bax inhibitor-1 family protein [Bacilli bacterium]|nr:Bax inhibitor-1 family protein [Bacilli bacterium]